MFDMEFGHFLANPIRITQRGPRNLSEIAAVHQNMCNIGKKSGLGDETYEILKSYPAVILICDRNVDGASMGATRDDDGLINLRKVAEHLTVLVMRTGASSSHQVLLDDLEPHALPLGRSDAHGIDVRRVSLSIAVDFIVSLENRIRGPKKRMVHTYDSDLCRYHEIPDGFDQTVKNDPQLWVAVMKESIAKNGPDCLKNTQEAIQQIKSRVSWVYTAFDLGFEHDEWSRHWKSGYDAALLRHTPYTLLGGRKLCHAML
jgi:hypothetical protein